MVTAVTEAVVEDAVTVSSKAGLEAALVTTFT